MQNIKINEDDKISVICIIGKSGSGKSTYANKIFNSYPQITNIVKSYTTRKVRDYDPNDINTHIFVDMDFYNKSDVLLEYRGDGYYNFVTPESFDKDLVNLFVVDIDAYNLLCNLPQYYVTGIYLNVSDEVLKERCPERFKEEPHLELSRIINKKHLKVIDN